MAKPITLADLGSAIRSARRVVDDTIAPPSDATVVAADELDRIVLRAVAFREVLRELLDYELDDNAR